MDIVDKVAKLNKEHGQKIARGTRAIEKAERHIQSKVDNSNKQLRDIDDNFRKKHKSILR